MTISKMWILRRVFLVGILIAVVTGAEAQRVTGQMAAGALERGDYALAYEHYTTLLESFPRDPHYLYGAGVALVEMRQRPLQSITWFESALSYSSAMRAAPEETLFYLGRARHLAGRYEDAIEAYERYAAAAGRRVSRRAGIPDLIKECREERGSLSPEEIAKGSVPVTKTAGRAPLVEPPVLLPPATDTLLTEALRQRRLADTTGDIRSRRAADSLMNIAAIPEVQFTATVAVAPVRTEAEPIPVIADTAAGDTPAIRPANLFGLKEGGYYSPERPVTVSETFPAGLLHTIQFGAFRNPLAPSYFKRLYPVFGIRAPGRDVTFYYTGLFRSLDDARRALQQVRNEGFRDAFVVHFFDGRQISDERAALLEASWRERPLPEWEGVVPELQVREPVAKDTTPQTLMLRVDVLRTDKEVDQRLKDEISRLAGVRGFDIIESQENIFVYVVGNFLTFESASSYADLLRRNGYLEARVAAYIGKREIPVETALKLMGIER